MATTTTTTTYLLLLLLLLFSTFPFLALSGIEAKTQSLSWIGDSKLNLPNEFMPLEGGKKEEVLRWKEKSLRRLMIGSTAPTCTYNECRGCRFRCRAEQVPVDANDPMNSAYHYRCVCHRW